MSDNPFGITIEKEATQDLKEFYDSFRPNGYSIIQNNTGIQIGTAIILPSGKTVTTWISEEEYEKQLLAKLNNSTQ